MSIPKEIAAAVVKTTRDVGTLIKESRNSHDGYDYVNVDTFYEKVGGKAAANGLSWVASESDLEVFETPGRNGVRQAIRVTYNFTLFHESGATAENVSRMTVLHAMAGAQTAGSALSYAQKNFMRQTFKLATGEKGSDADETDPRELDNAPVMRVANDLPPPPAQVRDSAVLGERDGVQVLRVPSDRQQVALIEEVFVQFVNDCSDMHMLRQFWNENAAALDAVKKIDSIAYGRVKEAFGKRRGQLERK